ncbi:hypothetical protein HSR122_0739 [Halapricum desulfuricans]|uniref:Uncharacterized protein n=1 Tax=Halapricum desulfuricans TaxID=2841257 RepID=A0A897N6E9_9EURY|nr:hypothetical protein HSR122_0739 [Halapricum desulfuricans]
MNTLVCEQSSQESCGDDGRLASAFMRELSSQESCDEIYEQSRDR